MAFAPNATGSKSAYVTLSSSTPDAWTFDLPLTGTGEVTKVTLLSPNGGEVIPSGLEYVVHWGAPLRAKSFKLFYSIDNGATWNPIVTQNPLRGVSYLWHVPRIEGNKPACRIKVVGYNGPQQVGSDVSDAPFSIEVVKLLSPNGSELFHPWTPVRIEWRTSPQTEHFDLMLSTDHGLTWDPVQNGKWNVGTTLNTIFLPPETGNKEKCLIKVVAYNPSGRVVGADRSDRPFSIEVLNLTEPNGGGLSFKSGDLLTITWDTYMTAEPIANVLLFYTLNGGTTWKPIISLPGGSSSHKWTVPKVTATKPKCKVKVVLKDVNGIVSGSDMSDSFFTITP